MTQSKINIIAEIGTSHEGSFDKAKKLVDYFAQQDAPDSPQES